MVLSDLLALPWLDEKSQYLGKNDTIFLTLLDLSMLDIVIMTNYRSP